MKETVVTFTIEYDTPSVGDSYIFSYLCGVYERTMIMRHLSFALLLLATSSVAAQSFPAVGGGNTPFIHDQFTADPTARVFNDRVYVYPSHDIPAPEGQRQDWFCMADYHVFSSPDLSHWTDHGVIVTQNAVPWVRPDSYSMWAPDCVCKDGKYYFYFPSAPKEGRGFAIGVATADRPEGPFTCEQEPIKGVMGIDPCVLVDDDGQAYIYWSGMGIRGARLNADMKRLDGELTTIQGGNNSFVVGGQAMEGLPEGFKEGPFAFKHDGHYYLTFPWVRKENGTETLAYAMSKSPLGPWEFKGIIMAESATGCWTNHHSIVEFHGQWYLFYHHNDYSPKFDKLRSARIDRLSFNADGTIQEVKPTLRGVGTSKATDRIDIDRYSVAGGDVALAYNDTLMPTRGWHVTLSQKDSWLAYTDVDFQGVNPSSYLVANVKADDNATIIIREDNAKGKVIARIPVQVESNGAFRRDLRNRWMTVTATLEYIPRATCGLHITVEGANVGIDWLQFKNRENYFLPATGNPASPDQEGFIRRWSLLEPIDKPNRSNTAFTDSYLREAFAQQYFPNQMTIIPKDGQKVKVGKQTLAWHTLDSQLFNVKLFRFADLLQKQLYGVLFWAVTVIDCPEDIENVRLAVGSNGASMWWLNGEEALLLSGDRRMVKDDGVSQRLSLHKGRNVLRGAVINGPGMSDFCVRFINEKGEPVTNYEIRF